MTTKRALVVDDSKSARIAMKRMLKKYALKVEFAESGEEALLFLEHSSVDVIFMDHTMPGMDGLEAVAAIKSNVRTATIPVMMYTTKNDDVYVSQARALGALAVLPKEVQPGVLFDTLLKLGLVENRREEPEDVPFAQIVQDVDDDGVPSEADKAFEQQALGVSIQTQITRTLEEQHLQLRSDILNVKREFAKRVSREILDQQRADHVIDEAAAQTEIEPRGLTFTRVPSLAWIVLVLLSVLVISALMVSGLNRQDQVSGALDTLSRAVEVNTESLKDITVPQTPETTAAPTTLVPGTPSPGENYLGTLEWALNENGQHDYTELSFNIQTIAKLETLLTQLDTLGFRGEVQLESHLGAFCLVSDGAGSYVMAPGDLPLTQCALLGHPKDESVFINDQQSVEFVNFIDASFIINSGTIRVTTIANNRQGSVPEFPAPVDVGSAGEWNRIARLNNRIVYTLIPD